MKNINEITVKELIDDLGGVCAVARLCSTITDKPMLPSSVTHWKTRFRIPFAWRKFLLDELAKQNRKKK